MPRKSLADRILDRVAECTPISAALLASDLGVRPIAIQSAIRRLMKAGRLRYGWDDRSVELTDEETKYRAYDAAIRNRRVI